MWLQAMFKVLQNDAQQHGMTVLLPFLGAVIGASVGSIRRWYWARWQVGFLTALCLGNQLSFLLSAVGTGTLLPAVGPIPGYDQWTITAVSAAVLGLLVSLLTEALLRYPPSSLVERFRERPFQWLCSRSRLSLGILVLACVPLMWSALRWSRIVATEERLRLEQHLPELERKWAPYNVLVRYEPGGYVLHVGSASAFEEPAIQGFAALPGPIEQLGIMVDSVGDEVLERLAPNLKSARIITLHDMRITKNTLDLLATFPQLKNAEFVNCHQLAREDFLQFHEQRPDVRLYVLDPDVKLQIEPSRP